MASQLNRSEKNTGVHPCIISGTSRYLSRTKELSSANGKLHSVEEFDLPCAIQAHSGKWFEVITLLIKHNNCVKNKMHHI
jgi:hypothetical protein